MCFWHSIAGISKHISSRGFVTEQCFLLRVLADSFRIQMRWFQEFVPSLRNFCKEKQYCATRSSVFERLCSYFAFYLKSFKGGTANLKANHYARNTKFWQADHA